MFPFAKWRECICVQSAKIFCFFWIVIFDLSEDYFKNHDTYQRQLLTKQERICVSLFFDKIYKQIKNR